MLAPRHSPEEASFLTERQELAGDGGTFLARRGTRIWAYRPSVRRSGMTKRAIDPVIGRRAFCLSLGAGLTIIATPGVTGAADLKKVPMSTGIDAVFVPYIVAADRKIFEKYGLEASYKPFDDGNVALDAVLTGASDIGSTSELGGLARWDK